MQTLMYNGKPVFILELPGRGKSLVFPKAIVTDIFEQKIFIKCDHGLIPFEDLTMPNHQDEAWISKSFDMKIFQVEEWGGRFTHTL